ncbi:SCNM1 protein, partial [Rhadina sibilatrix]|nr:SCNM1 protein [Rhadina sibilatrix]
IPSSPSLAPSGVPEERKGGRKGNSQFSEGKGNSRFSEGKGNSQFSKGKGNSQFSEGLSPERLRILRHHLHLRSRGWLQDPAGNWVKDGNAEFDSDEEEPPPLPPA